MSELYLHIGSSKPVSCEKLYMNLNYFLLKQHIVNDIYVNVSKIVLSDVNNVHVVLTFQILFYIKLVLADDCWTQFQGQCRFHLYCQAVMLQRGGVVYSESPYT